MSGRHMGVSSTAVTSSPRSGARSWGAMLCTLMHASAVALPTCGTGRRLRLRSVWGTSSPDGTRRCCPKASCTFKG